MGSPLLSSQVLRFGPFELDSETQQLRKAGVLLRIQRQPFKVLIALVTRHGEIVTRDELRRELWGDETFVDFEQGLNYCIRQIRDVLGDNAQAPLYIETVPRRGYRFIAPVDGAAVPPGIEAATKEPPHQQRRIRAFAFASIAVLALVLLAVSALDRYSKRASLTARDSILITEFSNSTHDPAFDGTLRRAISVDLGQSPYLDIVSDESIGQALRLMNLPPDTRITREIGREICQRSGTKAMLTGSIASLGNQYLLTMEVVNTTSDDILAEESVQAVGKEQVLNALGKSNDRLRKKLGESLASIQQFGKPLEHVTTSSLEALQLFTLGMEKRNEGEYDSVQFFQRAIQLDPGFALAHASLGAVYFNLEQLQLAEEYERKAIALSDRVSEKEKLYITAHYYLIIGQREKAILTYETYSRLYPRDSLPEGNLSNEYNVLGRFDKSLEHALNGIRLAPDAPAIRGEAATAYEGLGRLDEARAVIAEGLRRTPDSSELHLDLSNIALAQGDTATRNREDAELRATQSGNLNLLYRDASLAASRGRLREAQELYSQVSQTALKLGLKENASFAMALRAVYEAYLQKPLDARKSARGALKLSQMSDTIEPAAVALAVAGEGREAETLIDNLARHRPEDTTVQFIWVPTVHALVSLNHGDSETAIQTLGPAIPYDRGNLDPMLARANAFLQSKRAREAVEEFRRIVSQRLRAPYDPACSLAQLGLARAYAMAGDNTSSRAAYQDFLALWDKADVDIEAFREAKAELAKLQ